MTAKRYIIADLHFNHEGLLCSLPNPRPEDYASRLFRHMSKLTEEDTLYCLGDVCIGNDADMHEKYIRPLKCKKVLVIGNHDKRSYSWYLRHGWDLVCEEIVIKHNGKKYHLTHQPEFDSQYINIHGHYHNRYELQRTDEKHVLYSPEREGYMPVTIESLLKKDRHRKLAKLQLTS